MVCQRAWIRDAQLTRALVFAERTCKFVESAPDLVGEASILQLLASVQNQRCECTCYIIIGVHVLQAHLIVCSDRICIHFSHSPR